VRTVSFRFFGSFTFTSMRWYVGLVSTDGGEYDSGWNEALTIAAGHVRKLLHRVSAAQGTEGGPSEGGPSAASPEHSAAEGGTPK